MGKVVLVTGGSRSGKSDYAQRYAEAEAGARYFLATCPRDTGADLDMARRIALHQQNRDGKDWVTIEEELDLAGALQALPPTATVLIDCLSLWLNNLLFIDEGQVLDELAAARLSRQLAGCCRQRPGTTVLVSSEVGSGIVPENRLARRYRDLVGRCNQEVAAAADEVILVSCGLPLIMKSGC